MSDEPVEPVEAFKSTTTYDLPKNDPDDVSKGGPVHVEMADTFGERFEADFKPGKVTPKSEQEEAALEHLVAVGMATKKDA